MFNLFDLGFHDLLPLGDVGGDFPLKLGDEVPGLLDLGGFAVLSVGGEVLSHDSESVLLDLLLSDIELGQFLYRLS